jgi:mono/diheme cytochrome c family protein
VLLAAFGAFFGMLALNKLPMFSNPVFTDPRFDRATDDRFFLFIGANDAKYEKAGVNRLLGDLGSGHVADIYEDTSSASIPRPFIVMVGLLLLFSTVPLLIVARMRVTNSSQPRYHVFYDMDFSPAKDAQQTTTLFADGRTMRPDVPGTIAVGQYDEVLDFYTGIDMEELSRRDAPRATRLVRALLDDPATVANEKLAAEVAEAAKTVAANSDEGATEPQVDAKPAVETTAEPAAAEPMVETPAVVETTVPAESAAPLEVPAPAETPAPAAPAGAVDTTPWLTENPLELTSAALLRGREKFEIYCAVCHGNDGAGNGLVNRRAQRILATAWVQPSSMHQETLYADQYADGKLFNTITNGIRKMPGYASQITTKDRWAIVAYVRALQASQNASL